MSTATRDMHSARHQRAVYIFEAPVRIWHWTHTFSVIVLAATGYLISHPPPSIGGEASEHFLMGNIRLIHFVAAYVFAIGFLVRAYWALVGNAYSRELFIVPTWKADWWRDLLYEIKFYAFLTREIRKRPAHTALAQPAMWLFNVVLGVFMMLTGFALYSQGLGLDSWANVLFGWVIPLLGGSQSVRMWHLLGMWLFVFFTIFHIYMAIRAEIIGRQSSISTIISGWRMYRDDLP